MYIINRGKNVEGENKNKHNRSSSISSCTQWTISFTLPVFWAVVVTALFHVLWSGLNSE